MIVKNNPTPLIRPGASFVSNTNLNANTAVAVFLAAANTRGAIVWGAAAASYNPTGAQQIALLAKAAAPATVIDGVPVSTTQAGAFATGGFAASMKREMPYFIPPGLGLYFIAQTSETSGHRSVNYTIL